MKEKKIDICKRTTFETNGGWKLQRVAAKALLLFCNDVSFLFTKLNIFKIPTKRLKPPSYRNTPNIIPGSLVPVSSLQHVGQLRIRGVPPCVQQPRRQEPRPLPPPAAGEAAPCPPSSSTPPLPPDTWHRYQHQVTRPSIACPQSSQPTSSFKDFF